MTQVKQGEDVVDQVRKHYGAIGRASCRERVSIDV